MMKKRILIILIVLVGLLAAIVAARWPHPPERVARSITMLFECQNGSPLSMNVTGDVTVYVPSLFQSNCSLHGEKGTVTIRCPAARLTPSPLVLEGQRLLEGSRSE